MTGTDIIDVVRIATFDDKIEQQTWKDAKYLNALNSARSYLYSNHPESRINSSGTLVTFADIEESALSDTMWESDLYFTFLSEYVCYLYFSAASGDTQNSRRASEHYTAAMRALDPRYITRNTIGR